MSKRFNGNRKGKFNRRKGYNKFVSRKVDADQNKMIKNIDRKIKKLADTVELKYEDAVSANQSVTGTGTFVLLNGIPLGDTSRTREGNEVYCTSIQVKYSVGLNTSNPQAFKVRVLIVRDRQSNGVTPNLFDILDNTIVTDYTMSPYNYNNSERFRIYYDKIIPLQQLTHYTEAAGAVTAYAGTEKSYEFRRRLGWKAKYEDTGSAVSDMTTNSLFLIYVSNASSVYPLIDYGTRCYYKDA